MTIATIDCPKCRMEMRKVERSGVVIDLCTACGGIFLDRGELQALLAAETRYRAGAGELDDIADVEDPGQKRATRRGFLEELFDFS